MEMTTIGIDLAKNVFQIYSVDAHGNAVLRKKLDRSKMAAFFIQLQPCLTIGCLFVNIFQTYSRVSGMEESFNWPDIYNRYPYPLTIYSKCFVAC